ncbi:25793_t:CDS:1, partial [Racocetra persica]
VVLIKVMSGNVTLGLFVFMVLVYMVAVLLRIEIVIVALISNALIVLV